MFEVASMPAACMTNLLLYSAYGGIAWEGDGRRYALWPDEGVGMRSLHSGMGPPQSPMDQHSQGTITYWPQYNNKALSGYNFNHNYSSPEEVLVLPPLKEVSLQWPQR